MFNAATLRIVSAESAAILPVATESAIYEQAGEVDETTSYPTASITELSRAGTLRAVLPRSVGGCGIGLDEGTADDLRIMLTRVGRASLTVGRLFEGHVNAVRLSETYGSDASRMLLATEIAAGFHSGVWNAEGDEGLHAEQVSRGWRLHGSKVYCSGASAIRRPIVTAKANDQPLMFMPDMTSDGIAVDLSVWRAAGMRGTATGTVVFDAVFVSNDEVIGQPGDYYRSPLFLSGAWRVLAVQFGGIQAIMSAHAAALRANGRAADPVFRARFADAAGSAEAARLLVNEAATRAEIAGCGADAIDAYVSLARSSFEGLALTVIDAAQRNVGLSTFVAPNPLDRMLRDLETYLRQPFVDGSRDHAAQWLLSHGGDWD